MRYSRETYAAQNVKYTEHQRQVLDGVGLWASFYRAHIYRFAQDYLHLSLHLFQILVLWMMNAATTFVMISCRGLGKTWLSAVFLVCRCILYPGTKVCIASGTRGQAYNVVDKIMSELLPNSPELRNELDMQSSKLTPQMTKLMFKNGSYITVVTASDSARGARANLLLIDEFRMVKVDTIQQVLRKFLAAPRHPHYMDLPEFKGRRDLQERNKIFYLSSAWYEDHWSYKRCQDSFRFMLDENRSNFICSFPYELAIDEGMLMVEDVEEEMSEASFNEVKFSMEMEAEFFGSGVDAFFTLESVSKNRHIELPMLPSNYCGKLSKTSKLRIQPKQPGERRILSADIALMASTKHNNDATAIFVNSLMPTKAGKMISNIVYAENNEGMRTEEQALRIRKLFDEFDCDYLALDAKSMGLSIYDALARDMPDPDTGEVYQALSCCNNEDLAARCVSKQAPKVIWAMLGSAKFNSDCALLLREGFRSGRIRLLVTEDDAEMILGEMKEYEALSKADRVYVQMPYINTTLLVYELINLRHEESTGLVRISEKPGARKDRYSSLSYNFYVANQIEHEMLKRDARSIGSVGDGKVPFIFRSPGTRRNDGW